MVGSQAVLFLMGEIKSLGRVSSKAAMLGACHGQHHSAICVETYLRAIELGRFWIVGCTISHDFTLWDIYKR